MDAENIELEYIKGQLKRFFMMSEVGTFSQKDEEEYQYFNKDLFALEQFLVELKDEYKVNSRLDPSYCSNSIADSFSTTQITAFSSNDYSLPFLIHLCHQKEHTAEALLQTIHEFIESVKDKLTYKDILITKTGVTRCFTNTRFALKDLRRFGLIYNDVEVNQVTKRIVLPTPIGYLIALYSLTKERSKSVQFLSTKNTLNGYHKPLHDAIKSFSDSLENVINDLRIKYSEVKGLQRILKGIIEEYHDYVLPNIEFTPTKLIINQQGLHQSMTEYYKRLVYQYKLTNKLKTIFLKYYGEESVNQT